MSWKDDDATDAAVRLPNNHTMTSSRALSIVSNHTIQRILIPSVRSPTFLSIFYNLFSLSPS